MSNLQQVTKQLKELKEEKYGTLQGITDFTAAVLKLRTSEQEIFVQEWLEQVESAVESGWDEFEIIRLLYVANDIIQKSLKFTSKLGESFGEVLPKAFELIKESVYAVEDKVMNILKIWEDRAVYSEEYVQGLRKVFIAELQGEASSDQGESQEGYESEEEENSPQFQRQDSTALQAAIPFEQLVKLDRQVAGTLQEKKDQLKKGMEEMNASNLGWQDLDNDDKVNGLSDEELKKLKEKVDKLHADVAHSSILANTKTLLTSGILSFLKYKLEDLEIKVEEGMSSAEEANNLKSEIDLLREKQPDPVLATIIKHRRRLLKRKHPNVLAAENLKKQEELEAKRRKEAEEAQPKFWDKLTRSWKFVPQMGGIEDWRER
mmetsp:Transcript_14186/g.16610  ORF Transcript_14186/g.16610 Transcript_14186/m.16610 type:complete len:376 (-) Transcript_14186:461-1588(-)